MPQENEFENVVNGNRFVLGSMCCYKLRVVQQRVNILRAAYNATLVLM